jgi:septum formation protein
MLYLASQSPRRKQLLEQLGAVFETLDIDVVERRGPRESPLAYVQRVARDKAVAGRQRVDAGDFVLAADTEVVLGDDVFGKPADADDAIAMLKRLAGKTHEVISVVWLLGPDTATSASSISKVKFSAIPASTITDYVAHGECMGKAGAYAIQGRAAAFIQELAGSYTGVMGLPLFETSGLLARAGLRPS